MGGKNCSDAELLAVKVVSGQSDDVIITDRKALLPKTGEPATVSWKMQ